jgi:hypothetical protein
MATSRVITAAATEESGSTSTRAMDSVSAPPVTACPSTAPPRVTAASCRRKTHSAAAGDHGTGNEDADGRSAT